MTFKEKVGLLMAIHGIVGMQTSTSYWAFMVGAIWFVIGALMFYLNNTKKEE